MKAELSACKSGCRLGVEVRVEAVAELEVLEAAAGWALAAFPPSFPSSPGTKRHHAKSASTFRPKVFPFLHPELGCIRGRFAEIPPFNS